MANSQSAIEELFIRHFVISLSVYLLRPQSGSRSDPCGHARDLTGGLRMFPRLLCTARAPKPQTRFPLEANPAKKRRTKRKEVAGPARDLQRRSLNSHRPTTSLRDVLTLNFENRSLPSPFVARGGASGASLHPSPCGTISLAPDWVPKLSLGEQ